MAKRVVVNMARLVLAAVLTLSGFVKAVDPTGTQYKIADYLEALHLAGWADEAMTLGAAVLLSMLEFMLGTMLLLAVRRRTAALLTLGLLMVMTPLTLWLALANPISDCGCFGDAVVLTNWQTFWKNVALLAMALAVWRWPEEMVGFVPKNCQWIVVNYSAIYILAISGLSLYDLPYFDFRPYHIGADLREGWQRMTDGEESPYAEFFMQRAGDGEDITDSLLNKRGYLFLLISPHLEKADDSQLDLLNEVYEYAMDRGYPFYCLTASGEKGINSWRESTGAEYPFCQTDDVTLKTMIRSNPGLMLLKDGVVIRKWSYNRLPDEYVLDGPLEQLETGQLPQDSVTKKILVVLLWYVLPLGLLVFINIYQHLKRNKKHEKENRSRQLENEPEPAGGHRPGQGTDGSTEG